MTRIPRIAFIGNSLPRRCGIATFTTDLQHAVSHASLPAFTSIVAITDNGRVYDYPPSVGFEVRQQEAADYVAAADYINAGSFDVVSLQHEFGIFGGAAGEHILALLERLTVPVVTTLHTVLAEPSADQARVFERVMAMSSRLVVMAEKGRQMLLATYGVGANKIEVIPHGIPDVDFVEPDAAKARLGFTGKTVILTFGLLSPNKGIEIMIDAMPAVLASHPEAIYVVLGATHPNLLRQHGEAYRQSLVARAAALGIGGQVVFHDQFVERDTLLEYIAMCDIYITPYLDEVQMTSGTLSYSFGLGKAVISTPYWHAAELLADGRGCMVPFGDSTATGSAVIDLLTDEPRRQAMRRRAYNDSRSMVWEQVAERYLRSFADVRPIAGASIPPRPGHLRRSRLPPALALSHLRAMTDDTGLLQHAIHSVPDRSHGYCVDDNARGLLLSTTLANLAEERMPDAMTEAFAAFVQHAFNSATGRFRNFMSFDRRWLEDQGSEDSHGRTLWALGAAARFDTSESRRRWATGLFAAALPVVAGFSSPRAWAFTLLGLDAYCVVAPDHAAAAELRAQLADRLLVLLIQVEAPDWVWFEENLTYDNARFCEAMIRTGRAIGNDAFVQAGLRSLTWLMTRQTSTAGLFRPIGTDSFQEFRSVDELFDQQPLEATATIAACHAALRETNDLRWRVGAERAFAWFLGENDLSRPLVDVETGSCRDGLHPDRRNENRGAESVLSYLLGLVDIRQAERLRLSPGLERATHLTRRTASRSTNPQLRGRLVASRLS